jgi:ferric-dicitrate binding protein FerR (iron transport regulator)
MEENRIVYLLQLYASGHISPTETEELWEYVRKAETDEALRQLILEARHHTPPNVTLQQQDWDRIWQSVQQGITGREKKYRRFSSRVRLAAAACLLAITAGLGYLLLKPAARQAVPVAVNRNTAPIVPGGNKAVLTLADGSQVVLDTSANGEISQQGNSKIIKLGNGNIAYRRTGIQAATTVYNTLSTPRGGQYALVLPDGSKVWLNAASSLRFPAFFSGRERTVELTGEAYFEIAPNASMPFHVKVPAPAAGARPMDIQVLGTHFNVNAYANEEASHTTLLEGKVRVVQDGAAQSLQPGTEAVIRYGHNNIAVQPANTAQAIAWKNGEFRFRETGIRELMRQVERWYDVEVVFNTTRTDQDFTGIIPRSKNVTELLKTLELTGTVHFRIEGRKIIVLP